MRTIKQVADELGVSTTTVYKRLKRLQSTSSSGRIVKNGSVTYVDDVLFNELRSDSFESPFQTFQAASNSLQTENAALQAKVSELQAQLKSAESDISFLREELQGQREITRNMQVLLKAEQDRHQSFWRRLLPAGKNLTT
ncbi:MAG TPA: HTH domain-containing protein [Bacteroidales bacterium]|nr:HTH domain-containing protein [Bacteroidales bacterium]